MSHKIVLKIGGSNLKNEESLSGIISLAKAYPFPVIVVVSAFFGVTNRLEALNKGYRVEELNRLQNIHVSALKKKHFIVRSPCSGRSSHRKDDRVAQGASWPQKRDRNYPSRPNIKLW